LTESGDFETPLHNGVPALVADPPHASLILGGIVLPLLIAAVLGGEAIRAGGGVVGFFFIAGLFTIIAGENELGQEMIGPVWAPWALWGGGALMVLGGAGFWIIGWIAKVPMWIQAPFLGSPRVDMRGRPETPRTRCCRTSAQHTAPAGHSRRPRQPLNLSLFQNPTQALILRLSFRELFVRIIDSVVS
jgi:hypothetical protein